MVSPLRLFATTAILFHCFTAFAQPVFTYSALAPQSGDQYTGGHAQGVLPGNPGANQTWNFSSENILSTVTYSVNPTTSIPCGSQYPSSNLGIGPGSYDMMQITASEYNCYGNTVTPGMADFVYTDPEKRFVFPMNYTNSFSDVFSGVSNVGPTAYRTGGDTVTYDGYGTVITPFATYTNALRIRREVTWTDSSQSGSPVICSGDYYYWFAPGYRYPVAQVWYVPCSNGGGGGAIFLQSITIGIQETELAARTLSATPNPFANSFLLHADGAQAGDVASICDVSGRLVKTFTLSGTETVIDLEGVEAGVYFIRVNDGRSLKVAKEGIL